MSKIYHNILELIGHTPIVELEKIAQKEGITGRLLAKLEYFNPAGSVKDRVAMGMLKDARERGILKAESTIIEPTSGNTGIGLASAAAALGYKSIFVMPETMSIERRKLLQGYGARIVLTEGSKGMTGAIKKAEELAKEIPDAFIPSQFDNAANPKTHRETTGPEIWEDTDGKVDIFVAGIGTGGTLSGVGEYLKEKNKSVQVVGVEPAASPIITKGVAGVHKIQGIGAGFVPSVLNQDIYNEILTVENDAAIETAKRIAKEEGILVGISSGAAVSAAIELLKRPENQGKTVVALLPDTGERYLSTELFD